MKRILTIFIALLAAAGCSKENSGGEAGAVEIKLASKTMTVATKAPFEGVVGSGNELRAFIPVSATSGNYAAPYAGSHGYMKFADNATTAAGFVSSADWTTPAPKYYDADASKPVYMCGLYPHDVWRTTLSTTAAATIDGKSDLMAAKEVASTKLDVQSGGTIKTLDFKHLLTKLDIELMAENADAKESWGAVTSLVLSKAGTAEPANTATVTLSDGTATFSGAADTKCYKTDDAEISATSKLELPVSPSKAEAYTLCQPVNASTGSGHYTLEVTTENHTSAYGIPLTISYNADFSGDKSSTAGQAFTVTLTFKSSTIQAKATVAEWEDAGTATGTIQ